MQMDLDAIKQSLTCGICMDIVTLPVHGTCCDNAKSASPACLACVRAYCELQKPPRQRIPTRKSWTGCGCTITLNQRSCSNFYNHTYQLDLIRNSIGPSICHHENCGVSCETSAELRRHLTGNATSLDKHGNCQEAYTKCNYCIYFDKRHIVDGIHYETNHAKIYCDVCGRSDILVRHMRIHYNNHKEQLKNLRIKLHDFEDKNK